MPMLRIGRFTPFGLVLVSLMLAGCPTVPRKPEPIPVAQPWETRRAQLQARDSFELRARVAVAAGQEGFNAKLRWKQSGAQSDLALDGPLGVGGVRVSSNGTDLTVVNSKGQTLDSDAARAEIAQRLGFEPPISSLRYWVLGVPDPSVSATEELDEEQRLRQLQQSGWNIEYGSYMAANGEWLPQRMTLQREGVRVRLIVDGWSS
jgi:outer membrane lipoprotein LolB